MRLRFDIEWRLALATAVLFPALVALGFWQLQRAEEKVALQVASERRLAQPALPLARLEPSAGATELGYRKVEVSGHFHPEAVVMKDNQLRDGRYGVDVVGLFLDHDSQRWVLLNRGWVPADPARRSLPAVAVPRGEQRLTATIYVPPGDPYVLAEESYDVLRWPLLVQDLTAPALRSALGNDLGAELFPYELRLDAGEPGGWRRDWPVVNSSPERHRGYALQWFTMALVLLLLFAWRSCNIGDLLRAGRDTRS